MIFTLAPNYRNCPNCKRKVVFSLDQCANCRAPFPVENTRMIQQVQSETRQRMQRIWDGGKRDPEQVHFSKFYLYSPDAGYHSIIGMPLYTLEEILVVVNLLYRGISSDTEVLYLPQPEWIASFRPGDQDGDYRFMCLLSWQPLLWDEEKQIYTVGSDEGPRTVAYTTWE